MIPLYKLFAVTARLFTKPLVTIFKKKHKLGKRVKNSNMEKLFIFLGNREYKLDVWFNRRLLNIEEDADMFMKPLNEEVALEKGIEFFYEILIYSILILITAVELLKYSRDQELKKIKEEIIFKKINEDYLGLQSRVNLEITQLKLVISDLKNKIELQKVVANELQKINAQLQNLEDKTHKENTVLSTKKNTEG